MLRQATQNLITALYPNEEKESNSIRTKKTETYAKQNGFTNLRWYTDDGFSGANFKDPDFKPCLRTLKPGKWVRSSSRT